MGRIFGSLRLFIYLCHRSGTKPLENGGLLLILHIIDERFLLYPFLKSPNFIQYADNAVKETLHDCVYRVYATVVATPIYRQGVGWTVIAYTAFGDAEE